MIKKKQEEMLMVWCKVKKKKQSTNYYNIKYINVH